MVFTAVWVDTTHNNNNNNNHISGDFFFSANYVTERFNKPIEIMKLIGA